MKRWFWKRWVWAVVVGTSATVGMVAAQGGKEAPPSLPKVGDVIPLKFRDGPDRQVKVMKSEKQADGSYLSEVKDLKSGETFTLMDRPGDATPPAQGQTAAKTGGKANTPAPFPPAQPKSSIFSRSQEAEANAGLPKAKPRTSDPLVPSLKNSLPESDAAGEKDRRIMPSIAFPGIGRSSQKPETVQAEPERPGLLKRLFGKKSPPETKVSVPPHTSSRPQTSIPPIAPVTRAPVTRAPATPTQPTPPVSRYQSGLNSPFASQPVAQPVTRPTTQPVARPVTPSATQPVARPVATQPSMPSTPSKMATPPAPPSKLAAQPSMPTAPTRVATPAPVPTPPPVATAVKPPVASPTMPPLAPPVLTIPPEATVAKPPVAEPPTATVALPQIPAATPPAAPPAPELPPSPPKVTAPLPTPAVELPATKVTAPLPTPAVELPATKVTAPLPTTPITLPATPEIVVPEIPAAPKTSAEPPRTAPVTPVEPPTPVIPLPATLPMVPPSVTTPALPSVPPAGIPDAGSLPAIPLPPDSMSAKPVMSPMSPMEKPTAKPAELASPVVTPVTAKAMDTIEPAVKPAAMPATVAPVVSMPAPVKTAPVVVVVSGEFATPAGQAMLADIQPHISNLQSALAPSQRALAARALSSGRHGSSDTVKEILFRAAQHDRAPVVRVVCIEELAKLGYYDPGFSAFLMKACEDSSADVKAAAKQALTRMTPSR